jgi:hypothetical protein
MSGPASGWGLLTWTPAALTQEVVRAVESGLAVWIHAIGDLAQEAAVTAIENVAIAHPGLDHRCRVEHFGNEMYQPGRLEGLIAAAGIPAPNPSFITAEPDDPGRRQPPGVVKYGMRSLLAAGALPPGNSDTAARPGDPQNHTRARALRELLGLKSEFSFWWAARLGEAIGIPAETDWLKVGARCEAIAGQTVDLPCLVARDGLHAQLILNTGLVPEVSTLLNAQLMRAVLDGQCSETTFVRSEPAQIAVALSPTDFYVNAPGMHSYLIPAGSGRRAQAMQQLRKADSPFAEISRLRRFRRGERGSTFPWANTATALVKHAGRCWLATEIAVIGAASPLRNGYTLPRGAQTFGPAGHPSALIDQTRANKTNGSWWLEQLSVCKDDLSGAEWAFALWAVADGHVVNLLFSELARTIEQTSELLQRAMLIASQRLSDSGCLDQRNVTADGATGALAEMLARRNAPRVLNWSPSTPAYEQLPEPLAKVARRSKWLKVDQVATYR